LVGEPLREWLLGKLRRRWEGDIKMNVTEDDVRMGDG
jgi:hypothetical protein